MGKENLLFISSYIGYHNINIIQTIKNLKGFYTHTTVSYIPTAQQINSFWISMYKKSKDSARYSQFAVSPPMQYPKAH